MCPVFIEKSLKAGVPKGTDRNSADEENTEIQLKSSLLVVITVV